MTSVNEMRAEALSKSGPHAPNDRARSQSFGSELRSKLAEWTDPNGGVSERVKVEGYASVVDKKYVMYDMFGEYTEKVAAGAFDVTLSKNPDVVFLVNHRGVSMARTANGSLTLEADKKGLKSVAYLNAKRMDVQDLIVAIDDKDITEMSFAFMIDDGMWSEDYTEYTIKSVDLDRGDVSAVNYGANPYTSVAARQSEIMNDFRHLPSSAQRAVLLGLDLKPAEAHTEPATRSYALMDAMAYVTAEELMLSRQSDR